MRILRTILCSVIFMIAAKGLSAQVSFGQPELINDNWKFSLSDPEQAKEMDFDDSKWRTVTLPHDWSVEGQLSPNLASCTGYLPGGIAWYRKPLEIAANRADEKVYLYFEGVYNRSEVYLNGHLLGERPNGYISFMYDATPYVNFGGENTLAVRVDHSRYADSRWYTGSGIYRDAWIVYSNPIHIAQWGVYTYPTVANEKNGTLAIEIEVGNDTDANSKLTVVNTLLSAQGNLVAMSSKRLTVNSGESNVLKTELKIKKPHLWSIDSPNLYTLKTTILQDGKEIDRAETVTGFRTFTFDADKGFALNGNWMKMKGVCLHHDAGVLGAAVPREVWKRRLLTLKELGCNAVRTSHNAQAPDLYELCDELGMLVIDEAHDEWEFPKRKWLEGWNVGTPGFEGSYDFFDEWGEQDLVDQVRRDRNHVSIFSWSIGNEVDYPNDPYSHPVLDGGKDTGFTQAIFGGYQKEAPDAMRLGIIANVLASAVREYDKSRPVTAGLAGVAMSNQTEYPGALDVAGYNYTESMYLGDHKKYPNRVIYGSENRHDKAAWDAVVDNDFIFGQFLWTGIDYLGESREWPSRGFYSGLLNFGGFIKPRGYFRQSLWSDKPMAYLGTYPSPLAVSERRYAESTPSMDAWPIWNYKEDQLIRVVCYTNAEKARLLLNGNEVGKEKSYDQENGIIFWDIPYSSGKLEVVGSDANGEETTRHYIRTSGRPDAIKVDYAKGENGFWQIALQVVDKDGIPVMLSDNEIVCHIDGDAKLMGLEASDNSDMGDYTDNRQRVYHGQMIAYIKAKDNARVKFSSTWLKSAEVEIGLD